MEKGRDFIQAQIDNAVALHRNFIDSLEAHARAADDARLRALCEAHIPVMSRHQGMLEEYRRSLGGGEGSIKKALGGVLETAREWIDAARGDDFLCLVQDIVMGRQLEDTFKTFREAGRALGDPRLHELGERGEAEHDRYVQEANRLVQELFVEYARVPAPARA